MWQKMLQTGSGGSKGYELGMWLRNTSTSTFVFNCTFEPKAITLWYSYASNPHILYWDESMGGNCLVDETLSFPISVSGNTLDISSIADGTVCPIFGVIQK